MGFLEQTGDDDVCDSTCLCGTVAFQCAPGPSSFLEKGFGIVFILSSGSSSTLRKELCHPDFPEVAAFSPMREALRRLLFAPVQSQKSLP